jgi:hypothetical protein
MVYVHKFSRKRLSCSVAHYFHNKTVMVMDPDMATWDACEPKYSQLPFFSSTLKSVVVVVGTFFSVEQRIFGIVSYEMILGDKYARVLLNEFIYFKESGITKAPMFLGARRVMITRNWCRHIMASTCF